MRGAMRKGFAMRFAANIGFKGLGMMLLAGLCLPTCALADVKAGADAWSRGDDAAALREWQGPAARGDADAQYNLAQAYKLGRGVPQDLTRAEMLYAKAAQQGHLQAGDNYGLLLFQRGQRAAAMPYVRASAERGEPRALYLLGLAYFNADEVSKDWVRAYALESLAAQPTADAPALPQAKQALEQMDKYIPLEDRQKAVSLAGDLATQIEANRNRQLAAADLGTRPQPAAQHPTIASAEPKPASKPALKPAPEAPKPAALPAATGPWKLQLGAFGVAANADALWAKVKARPELSGHPRQNAPTGKVTRLLATGYSEDAAHAACRRLSGAGLSCIPVRD